MNSDERTNDQPETMETDAALENEAEAGSGEKNWPEEAQKFQDLYLRSAAEMENMRRRFQKEREEQAKFAAAAVIKGLLPVMDNLEMALNYVREDAPDEVRNLAEGVRMTLKGLRDVLASNGATEIKAERGQVFDPNLHEALGQCPETELAPGAISQIVQRGYMLYDRLIRPAKVMVATAAQ